MRSRREAKVRPLSRLGRFVKRFWFPLLVLDALAFVLTGHAADVLTSKSVGVDPLVLGCVALFEVVLFVVLLTRLVYFLPGIRGSGTGHSASLEQVESFADPSPNGCPENRI